MILFPKARPVRIRISSGGQEHSSFESFKLHFCVKDTIESAQDGRLSNWLKQQNQNVIADKIDSIKENICEQMSESQYVSYICAIFSNEIDEDTISDKEDIYDWMSKSKYNICPEFALIKAVVEKERIIKNKAEDDIKMRENYDFALSFYNNHNEARSTAEWIEIFNSHGKQHTQDGNYQWFMFQLTQLEEYIDKAKDLGHEEAQKMYDIMHHRFYGINEAAFKLCLSRIDNYDIKYDCEKNDFCKLIRKIKNKSENDNKLIIELECILDFWHKFLNFETSDEDYSKTKKLSILKNESILFKYMDHLHMKTQQYISDDSTRNKYKNFDKEYIPGQLLLKIDTLTDPTCKLIAKNKNKIDSFTFTKDELYDYWDSPNLINSFLDFIITHLFDEFEYEIQ